MPKRTFVMMAVLAMAIVPTAAKLPGLEYDYPVVASRWNVQLGGYTVDLDTSAAASYNGLLGSFVNLEDILGLEPSQKTLRIDGFYRIKPKHTLWFDLFQLRRSATQLLSEEFNFDDREFQIGGPIESKFDMDLFQVIYQYSFFNNGRINAGFAAGLSTFKVDASVEGQAILRDNMGNQISTEFAAAQSEVIAPIPSYGMFVDYAIRKWAIVRLSANSLDLDVGDISGRFLDLRGTVDFYFTKHVGIGLGVASTSLEYQSTGSDPLRIDYRYSGVVGYVGVSF